MRVTIVTGVLWACHPCRLATDPVAPKAAPREGVAVNLRRFIHLALASGRVEARAPGLAVFCERKAGIEVGLKGIWPRSLSPKLPALRFRAKIMLGFSVVLAISAVSMGIAYFGFERVSAGVSSYRNSVSEADLARNIDRELISYRGLARYFVVTGKEDDGKAARPPKPA